MLTKAKDFAYSCYYLNWTQEEDDFLRENYKGRQCLYEMSLALKRSEDSIKTRAQDLKIKTVDHRYAKKENRLAHLQALKDAGQLTHDMIEELAEKFKLRRVTIAKEINDLIGLENKRVPSEEEAYIAANYRSMGTAALAKKFKRSKNSIIGIVHRKRARDRR